MIDNTLEKKIAAAIESEGAKLYDIEIAKEFERSIFRIYITSPEGVDLDKCEKISKILSPMLDVESPVNENYFFEVSSPGVERILSKKKHYENSLGETINIKLSDGEKVKGKLNKIEGNSIALETTQGEELFDMESIKKAKTVFDWNKNAKK